MKDNTLLALALAKTLYSENRNYLDTFAPFIIRSLKSYEYKSINDIEVFLRENYSLEIPLNTIESILRRLESDNFVDLKGSGANDISAMPRQKALEDLEKANDEADKISRRQNKLVQKLREYFSEELNNKLSAEEIERYLKNYILNNISKLTLLSGSDNKANGDYDSEDLIDKGITRFLVDVYDREQDLYESFNNLLRGAVLWESIARKRDLDNEGVLEQVEIYIDTNIILSLLGLHHKSINRAAKQLKTLLQNDNKIYLRVFDKTIEEVINLLAGYKYYKDEYGSQRVNHVYYFLKKKGYDNAGIDLLIDQLEDKLEEMGIYKKELGYKEPSDLPSREHDLYKDLYSENIKYETKKDEEYQRSEEAIHKSTFHDVAIISKIRELRNGWQTSFEKCKSIFLTNSYRLYDFSRRNRINKQAITEVITDITLTNILWLKNPGSDLGITIDNLLYVHSSDFLVDNEIWKKFLRTLKSMHKAGEINEEEYALLTSKNQLTDNYLLSKQKDEINPESVKELNKDIKLESERKEEQIENKDKKIEELKEKDQEKDEKLEIVQDEKESLEQDLIELKKDHRGLKDRFKDFQINRLYSNRLEKKIEGFKKKTKRGIGLALLTFALIYLLVVFIKFMPELFPNGILGFDVSTPSFEFVFSTVLSVILVFGRAGYVSIKDSDWSLKEAYWAFWNEEKIEDKYEKELKSSAKSDYERMNNNNSNESNS